MVEYILVSCHAFKTHLLPKSMIHSLCMAEDVRSVIDTLLQTDYGAELSKQTKVDAHTLEKIFNMKLVERYAKLVKLVERYIGLVKFDRYTRTIPHVGMDSSLGRTYGEDLYRHVCLTDTFEKALWRTYGEDLWEIGVSSKDIYGIIKAYSRKLELQNIIRVLRGKFTKTPNERIEEYIIPLGKLSNIRFNDLLKAENIDVAIEMLKNTIYNPLTEALKLSNEFKSFLPIEMQLWALYYSYLLKTLSGIPMGEKEDLKRIIGTEIDVANAFVCTASVIYGYGKEFARKLLVPFSFKVSVDTFKIATQAESVETLRRLLNPYAKIIDYIMKGEDLLAQLESYRYIRREVEKQFLKDSAYAYILSYMVLCDIECKDLTFIALGKQYGLKPEELKSYLISLT